MAAPPMPGAWPGMPAPTAGMPLPVPGMPVPGMPYPGAPAFPGQSYPGAPGAPPPTEGTASGGATNSSAEEVAPDPNPTVYVKNLNEKTKIEDLTKRLSKLFSQFGNVLEVLANKRLKTRGQAWIIFDSTDSAVKAVAEMQNFTFCDKPMKVSFAKVKSDLISKADGSFQVRPKRKQEKKSRKKKGEKGKKKVKKEKKEPKSDLPSSSSSAATPQTFDTPMNSTVTPTVTRTPATQTEALPNRILFVENLPAQCTEFMLSMLFRQNAGYKEARLVPGKPGIAFVEFEEISQAAAAKGTLHNFKITPENSMQVNFAK